MTEGDDQVSTDTAHSVSPPDEGGQKVNHPFTGTKKFGRFARAARYEIVLASAFLAYVVYWSYVSVAKYYAMHAYVYDLGLFMQQVWLVTQPTLQSPERYLIFITYEPLTVILSPLGLIGSYPLILIVQTIALAGSAFPLYFISRRVIVSKEASLLVAISYLLYFPLAGPNWFDAHFETFFPLFFLTGYLLFLKGRYVLAPVFMFLGASTTYPLILLVILFGLIQIAWLVARRILLGEAASKPVWFMWIGLTAFSVLFFFYQAWVLSSFTIAQAASIAASTSPNITTLILVLSLFLIPVLFTPLLSPGWAIMITPAAYLILFGVPYAYAYPGIFLDQYPSFVVPFIFVGCVYGLKRISESWQSVKHDVPAKIRRSWRFTLIGRASETQSVVKAAIAILVVTALMALAYQPYGPLNGYATNFDVGGQTQVNSTMYNELQSLSNLVPRSTPYVLFQNDMPFMLPRPLDYGDTPLISSITDWSNLSSYDISHNSFPFINGRTYFAQIDYAIMNPYTSQYLQQGLHGISMYSFSNSLIQSGLYGVLGDVSSMILLERGYTGLPQLYVPFNEKILASSLWNGSAHGSGQSVISQTNVTNFKSWYGPQIVLSPGIYQIGFSLSTTNTSPDNRVYCAVLAEEGHIVVGNTSLLIRGSDFNRTNTWTTFGYTLDVDRTYTAVEFPGFATWDGTLSIQWVDIKQVAPPT